MKKILFIGLILLFAGCVVNVAKLNYDEWWHNKRPEMKAGITIYPSKDSAQDYNATDEKFYIEVSRMNGDLLDRHSVNWSQATDIPLSTGLYRFLFYAHKNTSSSSKTKTGLIESLIRIEENQVLNVYYTFPIVGRGKGTISFKTNFLKG